MERAKKIRGAANKDTLPKKKNLTSVVRVQSEQDEHTT